MKSCDDIREFLPLIENERSDRTGEIRQHLDACPECRAVQEDFLLLDEAAADIPFPEPESSYWDEFSPRLAQRMTDGGQRQQGKIIEWLVHRPVFSWPAAAAALVLVFFITRAMLPEGQVIQPPPVTKSEITEIEKPVTSGPPAEITAEENGVATIRPRPQPPTATESDQLLTTPVGETKAETSTLITKIVPETVAEQIPRESGSQRKTGKIPEMSPEQIPDEERESILAAQAKSIGDTGRPTRQVVYLRGDTAGTEIHDRGLPTGRDLELAERPQAPFPVDDTITSSETQRVLGAGVSEDYSGLDGAIPALNRGRFNAADRELITKRISSLSAEFTEKKGNDRRRVCRELVDMYYQLAVNWKVQAEVQRAIKFVDTAREILPQEDHADLSTKATALKSLLDE